MDGPTRKMYVFDFDDTLVRSPAKILVIHANGGTMSLSSSEYARYVPRKGDRFDYSEFSRLRMPKIIRHTTDLLRRIYATHGPKSLAILTARAHAAPIRRFLDKLQLHGIEIVAAGSADPAVKAAHILRWIEDHGLESIEFFDDSEKNIAAVDGLKSKFPDVHIRTHLMAEATRRSRR